MIFIAIFCSRLHYLDTSQLSTHIANTYSVNTSKYNIRVAISKLCQLGQKV